MGKKKDYLLPLPDDVGHDFEDDDFILNYRPVIEYVEPGQEFPDNYMEEPAEPLLDDLRNQTQGLIDANEAVGKLADLAQQRIDNRVAASGGLTIQLDPKVDGLAIAAMKRRFPGEDPAKITYDMYKNALDCIDRQAPTPPKITDKDIRAAKADPLRKDFGGLGKQPGQNRAEVNSPMQVVEPVDLEDFQDNAVISLFALLLPMIMLQDQIAIIKHKIDTPHPDPKAGGIPTPI